MGPIIIYYHVNKVGIEYNWRGNDCPQKRTEGYNGISTHMEDCLGREKIYICISSLYFVLCFLLNDIQTSPVQIEDLFWVLLFKG